jgi:phage terminase Nu1 subunit (DNA packaging protein)
MKDGNINAEKNSASLFDIANKWITKEQLANCLGVSISLVSRLMTEGLPYLKVSRAVRFRLGDVETWLLRRQTS